MQDLQHVYSTVGWTLRRWSQVELAESTILSVTMKLATIFTLITLGTQISASVNKNSWIDRILQDIKQAVTCGGCEV